MKKNIVFITASPYSNVSMGKIAKYISNALVEDGNSVTILGFGHNPSFNDGSLNKEIAIFPVSGYWGDKESIMSLNKYLYDKMLMNGVTHVLSHGDSWYFNNIALPLNTKNIFYCNVDSDEFPDRHWQIKLWDKLIFPLNFAEEAVLKTIPKLNQTEVITHFVDETKYVISQNEELLKLKQNPNAPFILGYVGVNNGRKNIYSMLRTIAEVKNLNLELWLVTENASTDGINIREVAAQLGITNKIKLFPKLSEEALINFYNSIDAYVSSSLSEAFGLPLIEAQACGIPIIANDIAAHREIAGYSSRLIKTSAMVAPNSSAMLLKFPDINNFKQHIIGMYNTRNKIRTNEFKNEVRKGVEKYFWSNVKDTWLHSLDDVKDNLFIKDLAFYRYNGSIQHISLSSQKLDYVEYRSQIRNIKETFKNKKLIGIYKDGNLGDIIGTLPLTEALRKKYPGHAIGILLNSNQMTTEKLESIKETFLKKFYDFSLWVKPDFVTWDIQLYDLFDILVSNRYLSKDITNTLKTSEFFDKNSGYYDSYVLSNSHLGELNKNVVSLEIESFGFTKDDYSLKQISEKFIEKEIPELKDKKFIYLDNNSSFSPTKLLIKENYADLISNILTKYPEYMIVHNYQEVLDNEKNDRILNRSFHLSELVWIIKHASSIITVENAISWLAYIFERKDTIVMFSNTSDKVFDLGLNNLSAKQCYPCWWASGHWAQQCLRGEKQCLNIVSVENIMNEISKNIK